MLKLYESAICLIIIIVAFGVTIDAVALNPCFGPTALSSLPTYCGPEGFE